MLVLAVALLVGASLLGSGCLFRHPRVLTYVAAAGALFEGQWLFLTLIDRTLFPVTSSQLVFIAGSVLLLGAWLLMYRQWSWPYRDVGSGKRDGGVLGILVLVALGASVILRANGWQEMSWVSHGFYNGDTATFISLTEKSLKTSELLRQNPFAANGPLEYPTLLHAGAATLAQAFGATDGWTHFLPLAVYLQLLFTIPIFFLLADLLNPEPIEEWRQWYGVPRRWAVHALQAGTVLYVLAASWDHYVYPQSHFFLLAPLLLLAALYIQGETQRGRPRWWTVAIGAGLTLVLLLANAVTGTVAVALTALFYLLSAATKAYSVRERSLYAAGVLVWLVLFLLLPPGDGSFGLPHFSYTAALDMLRLAAPLLLLVVGVLAALPERRKFLPAAVMGVALLAFVVFVFSTREIIVDNASRFFYYALVLGWPLTISPLVRGYYALKRELVDSSRMPVELAAGWGAVLLVAGLFLLPALASVASAYDNLLYKDAHVLSLAERVGLEWLVANTDPTTVILASPDSPWNIPMFTGRALLRANYWLSPDDALTARINKAFAGDKQAQTDILGEADYLALTEKDKAVWGTLTQKKVFDSAAITIYQLK